MTKDCDIVHFFWRENIRYFCPFFKTKREKIISTCVYDHLHLQDKEIIQRKDLFNHVPYYVSSNKLYEIYKSIHHYKDPILTIEDGVDEKNFYPINLERFENDQKPLIIGWVGNSQWGEDDHKGFNTFIKPAVNYFEEHNINIKSNFCDKVEKMVPHEEMVHYYSQIDILVCMSKSEGTPNPVLEAMACGVPIISTDVGIVSQAFGDLQKRFILPERSMNALLQAILEMYHQRRLLKKLSEENLVSIKGWYWDNQIIKFKHFFDQLSLQHNKLETNNNKKEQNITKTVTFCSKS